jgi:CRP-like cAMP-binding protein
MPGTQERQRSRGRPKFTERKQLYQPTSLHDPENMILAALPREQYSYLRKYLEFVPLRSGVVLWEPNQAIESIYFPNRGIVCFVAVMSNGAMVGVAMTGREGFVGTPVALCARDTSVRAIVQIDGDGFRVGSDLLRQILPRTPQLDQLLRRYAHAYAMQVAQTAACNCLHQIPERLARWLAMSYDRTESEFLPVTQESLAQMLGCRRSSVGVAIGSLRSAGVICCGRGHIRVLNRKDLERKACECYEVMRRLSHPVRID